MCVRKQVFNKKLKYNKFDRHFDMCYIKKNPVKMD